HTSARSRTWASLVPLLDGVNSNDSPTPAEPCEPGHLADPPIASHSRLPGVARNDHGPAWADGARFAEEASVTFQIQRRSMPRELSLGGELDLATAPELALVLGTISSAGDIMLDLAMLHFVDLSGLRVFEATAERLGGSLVL